MSNSLFKSTEDPKILLILTCVFQIFNEKFQTTCIAYSDTILFKSFIILYSLFFVCTHGMAKIHFTASWINYRMLLENCLESAEVMERLLQSDSS